MPPLKFSMLFLFVIYLLSSQFSFTAAADPTYVHHVCSETANFTRNSTFESNLNRLLTSLPTNASRGNGFSRGFFNATAGQDANRVYSLFLCRGDQTTNSCQNCVTFANRNVTRRCPESWTMSRLYLVQASAFALSEPNLSLGRGESKRKSLKILPWSIIIFVNFEFFRNLGCSKLENSTMPHDTAFEQRLTLIKKWVLLSGSDGNATIDYFGSVVDPCEVFVKMYLNCVAL
ncbi:hypothetical protein WN944_014328 [Citrus x changshan-huyou]|uniref:Gnk2-homologous domain-containing protein n=1 Tax=Citrus x changshan-huyou TaxID=2935761 RepID=A0AAP0MBY3_9ROSI